LLAAIPELYPLQDLIPIPLDSFANERVNEGLGGILHTSKIEDDLPTILQRRQQPAHTKITRLILIFGENNWTDRDSDDLHVNRIFGRFTAGLGICSRIHRKNRWKS